MGSEVGLHDGNRERLMSALGSPCPFSLFSQANRWASAAKCNTIFAARQRIGRSGRQSVHVTKKFGLSRPNLLTQSQTSTPIGVRFGSGTDILMTGTAVRFPPESGHSSVASSKSDTCVITSRQDHKWFDQRIGA